MPQHFSRDYRRFPHLAAYIDRIGAVELNFKKFMIQDDVGNHYYRERSLIWINNDFTLGYKNVDDGLKATEAEAIEIKAELEEAKANGTLGWHTSIEASAAQVSRLKRDHEIRGKLYEFRALTGDGYLMCQERRDLPDGGKNYLPWSFWSDGKWRMMEPEGALPFWKPKDRTPGLPIMIHEGAKTAAYLTYKMEHGTLIDHPWYEELRDYSHWGMIGGAQSPHRADYDELRKAKPSEVIYVCDNDDEGKAAIKTISRMYGNALECVMFTSDFPVKFDLADPMPAVLFGPPPERMWLGKELSHYARNATWATDLTPADPSKPKGKKVIAIRRAFAKEWCHSVKPEVYIPLKRSNQVWNEKEFNHEVAAFSDADENTSRYLKQDAGSKSVTIAYRPDKKPGVYMADGITYINTHVPSIVRPRSGDASLFEDFLVQLIPDGDERMVLKKWLATIVARPDIRMGFAILLVSETQGTGKTTFQYIAEQMVGGGNTSWPPENEIVESNWTYWCSRKRLACIAEIYQGHSYKAYNKLKDKITDAKITVSEKFLANYTIDNWLHVIACSNDLRALKLDDHDRRWFIPTVVEKVKDRAYWTTFYSWLREKDGYGIIMASLIEFARGGNIIGPSEHPPKSKAKDEMIIGGYSEGQTLVLDLLNNLRENANGKVIVLWDEALRELLKMVIHNGRTDRLERCHTIRKVASQASWYVGEDRVLISELGMVGRAARLITTDPIVSQMRSNTYEQFVDRIEPVAGTDLIAKVQAMNLL
jgi:hypothetical protein